MCKFYIVVKFIICNMNLGFELDFYTLDKFVNLI